MPSAPLPRGVKVEYERFKARLMAEEARQVRDDMRLLGRRQKADYVRDCLLDGRAGRAENLSCVLGTLALAIDAWLAFARETAPPFRQQEMARLTVRLVQLLDQIPAFFNRDEF